MRCMVGRWNRVGIFGDLTPGRNRIKRRVVVENARFTGKPGHTVKMRRQKIPRERSRCVIIVLATVQSNLFREYLNRTNNNTDDIRTLRRNERRDIKTGCFEYFIALIPPERGGMCKFYRYVFFLLQRIRRVCSAESIFFFYF